MKILAISEAGYSCDLILRMQANGHQTRTWIKEKNWKKVYDGILDKVDDWEPHVKWADWIFFDHSGMSDIRKKIGNSKPCFGGSEWADKLEKDRLYAHSVFKDLGFKQFESIRAKNFDEAIKHVTSHKVKHVCKPSGKDVESHHVIISDDPNGEDAASLLSSFKDKGINVDYIEIEERKEGIEVGISVWFTTDKNGVGNWSGDINVNFEHKRFATGFPEGLGFLTGEMGTAMRYSSPDTPLFKKTVSKMAPILSKNCYRGQIDVSFIVTKDGQAFPLEATPRLGYPACMIEQPLNITPFEELFYNIAIGNTSFNNKTSSDWAVGVVVVSPGFPSVDEAKKKSDNLPIFGVTSENIKNVHLVEVAQNPGEKLHIVPGMGYPMVVTGTGPTIQDAKKSAYSYLNQTDPKRLRIPNSWWRTDIGDRVIRQEKELYRLGILEQSKSPDVDSVLSHLLK